MRILLIFLLYLLYVNQSIAQLSNEEARAKLKRNIHVFENGMDLETRLHVKYDMIISTFSQSKSVQDTAHIEIKKINDKISFNINNEHIMLSEGKRSLYYFVPQKAMQYAEDSINSRVQLDKLFFAEMLPFIDSANYVLIDQVKDEIRYTLKYADSTYYYQNIKIAFDRNTGIPLSIEANFTQSPYQPYANMQVNYTLWDRHLKEKQSFPYFENYITKSKEGYSPLSSLGKVKYVQNFKPKQGKE